MGRAHDDGERVHPETVADWAAWLADNHERGEGVWLVSWKRHTGRPAVSYDDAVTEALRFGWIDSLARRLDDDRTMLWYSPRRSGSGWSRPNKQRIERLEAEGRMEAPGRAVIEQARADGTWSMLDDVENLIVPDDLAAAFDANPRARDNWEQFPRSARRAILEWIVQAKREATRAKRVAETARAAARRERANEWRPKG